ncbi:MAG: 3-deoxy-D-manno-octulosonic acid transferase [Salibacteraceae bacterium]
MILIYSFLLKLYRLAIGVTSLFSQKASLWIVGRKGWRNQVSEALKDIQSQPIWIHVSSVGEYEQGKPVLDALKLKYPNAPIVLTFFSPSGYELLKEKTQADYVFYLPLDGRNNSKIFLDLINPKAAVFIKYEFWYFYFNELYKRGIPFVLISAKLRPEQFFFQWYGKSYQKIFKLPSYYFVQDVETKRLLNQIGITKVSITGDTRIDRVAEILRENQKDKIVESHIKSDKVLILGSAWAEELDMLSNFLNQNNVSGWKFIIAPHEISETKINSFEKSLNILSLRYTLQSNDKVDEDVPVLIVDCIGKLKHFYKYGNAAFIGGGFGSSIHNILEPVVFGLPVIFGPNHHKFPEAKTLIGAGGAFVVNNQNELEVRLNDLMKSSKSLDESSKACKSFINDNLGATEKIMVELEKIFNV